MEASRQANGLGHVIKVQAHARYSRSRDYDYSGRCLREKKNKE